MHAATGSGLCLNKIQIAKNLVVFLVGLVIGGFFIKYNAMSLMIQTVYAVNVWGTNNSGILALVVAAVSLAALLLEVFRSTNK